MRLLRLWTAAGVAVVLVTVVLAGVASAQEDDGIDGGNHAGLYLVDSALYAQSVDGWGCHFFEQCRTEERFRGDPLPVALPAKRSRLEVECRLGAYYLVTTESGARGWSPSRDIAAPYPQWDCDTFAWRWGW